MKLVVLNALNSTEPLSPILDFYLRNISTNIWIYKYGINFALKFY